MKLKSFSGSFRTKNDSETSDGATAFFGCDKGKVWHLAIIYIGFGNSIANAILGAEYTKTFLIF